jgi:hypothetical protein
MAGMTVNLAVFLRARLDEDGARQKDSLTAWHSRDCESLPDVLYPDREPGACDCGVPERMLAEVEAKRKLVAAYESAVTAYGAAELGTTVSDLMTGSVNSLRYALQLAVLAYADHPGFKEEWLP